MKKLLLFYFILLLLNPLYIYAEKYASPIKLTDKEQAYIKDKKIVTMCIGPLWKPIAFINNKGEHEGIAADMINLIAQKTGIKVELVPTDSWAQSIEFSKEKKCDILSFANQTPKRDRWLIFTDIILEEANVLVGREEHSNIDAIYKIKNETIVLNKDTSAYERIMIDFPNIKVLAVPSEWEALVWVRDKKADLTLKSLIITKYMIQKGEFSTLKIINDKSIYTDYLRIGVQRNDHTLRDILNKGIRAISQKEHDLVISKYVYFKVTNPFVEYKYIIFIFVIGFLTIIVILFWNYTLRKKIAQEIKLNKEQYEVMFHSSKQAELGNLIANISHQWRDSLTKISYINLTLRAKIANGLEVSEEFLDKSTQETEASIDFMSETMTNFLDYYKPSSKISIFNAIESIKASMLIIDTKIKNESLEFTFAGELDTNIGGVKNEFMQVWINLITNVINIAIERNIKAPHIKITILQDRITLQDNCGGIDEKIVDNFKEEKYTGLGIKICKDVLFKNGKILTIQNSEDGVLFIISDILR